MMLLGSERRLTLLIVIVFAMIAFAASGNVESNFDEGVYIQQAKLIANGKFPFVHFLHHQPPLYVYLLGGWVSLGLDSFEQCRLFSILLFCFAAFLIAELTVRFGYKAASTMAATLFLVSPLAKFGIMAMPTSLMVVFIVAGFWAFLSSRLWLSPLFFVLAMLAKPVALPSVFVVPVVLLATRQWRSFFQFSFFALLFSIISGVLLYITTNGVFYKLLELQSFRLSKGSVFEAMRKVPIFAMHFKQLGISSVLEYNLYEHARSFLTPLFRNIGFFYVILALLGIHKLRQENKQAFLLIGVWFGFLFIFLMFIIQPAFDHYHLQYMPVIVILAALQASGKEMRQIIFVLIVILSISQTIFQIKTAQWSTEYFRSLFKPGETILAFNPTLHAIARTDDSCDTSDPLNAYGDSAISGVASGAEWKKFLTSDYDIIACLKNHPKAKVFLNNFLVISASDYLWTFVETLPSERVIGDKLEARVRRKRR